MKKSLLTKIALVASAGMILAACGGQPSSSSSPTPSSTQEPTSTSQSEKTSETKPAESTSTTPAESSTTPAESSTAPVDPQSSDDSGSKGSKGSDESGPGSKSETPEQSSEPEESSSEPVAPTVTRIELDTTAVKKVYLLSLMTPDRVDAFDYEGLKVSAKMSDGSAEEVDLSEVKVTAPQLNSKGEKEVKVTYEGFEASYNVKVGEYKATAATIADVEGRAIVTVSGVYDGVSAEELKAFPWTADFQQNGYNGGSWDGSWDEKANDPVALVAADGAFSYTRDVTELGAYLYTGHFGHKKVPNNNGGVQNMDLKIMDAEEKSEAIVIGKKEYRIDYNVGSQDPAKCWGDLSLTVTDKTEPVTRVTDMKVEDREGVPFFVVTVEFDNYTEDEFRALPWATDFQNNNNYDGAGWDRHHKVTDMSALWTIENGIAKYAVDISDLALKGYTVHFGCGLTEGGVNDGQPKDTAGLDIEASQTTINGTRYSLGKNDAFWGNIALIIERVEAPFRSYGIVGSFNGWNNAKAVAFTYNGEDNFHYVTIHLDKDTEFKVLMGNSWGESNEFWWHFSDKDPVHVGKSTNAIALVSGTYTFGVKDDLESSAYFEGILDHISVSVVPDIIYTDDSWTPVGSESEQNWSYDDGAIIAHIEDADHFGDGKDHYNFADPHFNLHATPMRAGERGLNYTVSVDFYSETLYSGNKVDKEIDAGIVVWYQDANNFITVGAKWANWDRPQEVRSIYLAGMLGGKRVTALDSWTDNCAVDPYIITGLTVAKTHGTVSFTAYKTNDARTAEPTAFKTGSFNIPNYSKDVENETASVGIYAANDEFIFSNFNAVATTPAADIDAETYTCEGAADLILDTWNHTYVRGEEAGTYAKDGLTLTLTPSEGEPYEATISTASHTYQVAAEAEEPDYVAAPEQNITLFEDVEAANYKVEFDFYGTATTAIDATVGVYTRFVDWSDFTNVFTQWSSGERPGQVRCANVHDWNGSSDAWNDIWGDASHGSVSGQVPDCFTSVGFHFSIVKTGNTYAVELKTLDGRLVVDGTKTVNPKTNGAYDIMLYAKGDTFSFYNFSIDFGPNYGEAATAETPKSDVTVASGNTVYSYYNLSGAKNMSVDMQGKIADPVSGDVDAQFTPWYADENNFLTIDAEWRAWDRSHEIRRFHVYGKLNGTNYNSGDIWADNPSNNAKPANIVHLDVVLEAGKLSFVATCETNTSWSKSFTVENAAIALDSYRLGFGSYGDVFAFSKLEVEAPAPAEPEVYATFDCGMDVTAAEGQTIAHADGSSAATYQETVNGVALAISDGDALYVAANDATGNGCLKLGTGKKAGSFKLTVPENVVKVVFMVAGYKATAAKISINGGDEIEVTSKSDEGAYTAIEATPVNGEITFTTLSGGYRCMINSIVFYA